MKSIAPLLTNFIIFRLVLYLIVVQTFAVAAGAFEWPEQVNTITNSFSATSELELALPADGTPPAKMTPVSRAGETVHLERTFLEEFSAFEFEGGQWQTYKRDGARIFEDRTISGNNEQQLYVDPAYPGSSVAPLGLNPFSVSIEDVLTITGQLVGNDAAQYLNEYAYTSGMISTENHFKQKYGYFEARMMFPKGAGLWSAFWLKRDFSDKPDNRSGWPPEIDVVEYIGDQGDRYHATSHWSIWPDQQKSGLSITVSSPYEDWHLYGVAWTAEMVVFYLDREPVAFIETKFNQHDAMHFLINMALGGKWPGLVDNSALPAELKIDWVAAWQFPEYIPGL